MDSKEIEYESIKALILEALLENTSSSAVNLWFNDIKLVLIDDNEAVFVTPTNLKKKVITQRFSTQLKEILGNTIGFEPEITINSSEDGEGDIVTKEVLQSSSETKRTVTSNLRKFNPNYTFENFVVGSSNNYAAASAKQVAESGKG